MGEHVMDVTDGTFVEEVLNSDVPVLVDFWAEWCGPCRAIAPHVDALAQEHAGKLKVVKVDIQNNMKTPGQFKVTAIPTLLVFKNGQMVGRQAGAAGGLPGLRSFVAPHV